MRDLFVSFKKCCKCEAEGDDFLFKGSLEKHVTDCENGCTMDDLTVQYGESEVLHSLALKELSDKYEAKNHEEALAMDDQDETYASVEVLTRRSGCEETQI